MNVVVHPLAADGDRPGDRLRVWVGIFGGAARPRLEWRLDGAPADPAPVRAMTSATPPDLRAGAGPRTFTGIYEFGGRVRPGRLYTVQAGAVVEGRTTWSSPQRIRTLPAGVPTGIGETFNVLMVSCFYQPEDGGRAGNLVDGLPSAHRPHLTLLLGDQVYLDLPLLTWRPNDAARLAKQFEHDYQRNWGSTSGYPQILATAPSASVPDDHEYWNNAPHAATPIPLTYGGEGRGQWRQAARAMYDAFQLGQPGADADAYNRVIDVPPLSFFLMDNRTFRQADLSYSLHPEGLRLFQDWAEGLAGGNRIGVIVTGQSLFQKPAGPLRGRLADRHLANYADYPAIMATITELVQSGRPVLCLTGDVHYGRIIEARIDSAPGNPLYEIISSPSSLVTTPPRLRRQRGEDWPRHRDPQRPPTALVPAAGMPKWTCRMRKGVRGNHVARLSFRGTVSSMQLSVAYHMGDGGRPRQWGPIALRPGR